MSRSPGEGARRVALELLDQAHAAALRWDDPADAAALHDFRVAIRRLRSTLGAWRAELKDSVRKKDRRKLRELQAATGAGRDAEVGIAWLAKERESLDEARQSGCAWLAQRLEERFAQPLARENAQREFLALEQRLRPRLELMQVAVHLTAPAQVEHYGDALAARLREHARELARLMALVDAPANRDGAHAARVQLKRLRYLAEPAEHRVAGVKELIAKFKRLQELLGALNDAHVFGAELDDAFEEISEDEHATVHALVQPGLLELALRIETQREALFVTLEREHLGAGMGALVASVETAALAIEATAHAGTEIERKYLLSTPPALPQEFTSHEIEQGWLPGKILRERVRRVSDANGVCYFRTVKLGRGITRTEIEEETTRAIFEALWPLTIGCRVRKRRYKVHQGDVVWEIDEFHGRDLFLAEIELRDARATVIPPAWLAKCIVREVTDETGFSNLELATA